MVSHERLKFRLLHGDLHRLTHSLDTHSFLCARVALSKAWGCTLLDVHAMTHDNDGQDMSTAPHPGALQHALLSPCPPNCPHRRCAMHTSSRQCRCGLNDCTSGSSNPQGTRPVASSRDPTQPEAPTATHHTRPPPPQPPSQTPRRAPSSAQRPVQHSRPRSSHITRRVRRMPCCVLGPSRCRRQRLRHRESRRACPLISLSCPLCTLFSVC